MAEQIRSYEVSIWTLQDSFVTVLKPSELEHKGLILNGIVEFADDGTEKLNFSIPMYYYEKDKLIPNPLWNYVIDGHLAANMHKIKLIFNKATELEAVYEFLVISVTLRHELDAVIYDIACEGLAFHELGKLGYKISLSGDDFVEEYYDWFKFGLADGLPAPRQTIQYWNDKVFYYTTYEGEKRQKYDWTYEVNMDWSDCSSVGTKSRDPHKVYEEEYVTSWEVDMVNDELFPTNVENFKEKWRAVDIEESNIYNITLTIAEKFGVYCRYEYEHDDNYHIVGKKVIYYNNNFLDSLRHIDITYPYSTSSISRTVDNTELATKLFVRPVDSEVSASNIISIATVDANKSKEDYILNFDYLRTINSITLDLYDAIDEFEFKVSRLNNRITRLDTLIRLMENRLNLAEADASLARSAIALDNENITNAQAKKRDLTGDDEVIFITEVNPKMLTLRSANTSTSSDMKMVRLPFEGILPESVVLYKTMSYIRSVDEGRLTDVVETGEFLYDEFNNPVAITNIYISDPKITRLYLTCTYSPKMYYDSVETTWTRRLAQDTLNLEDAEARIAKCNLYLYGCDVGYALADYALVEFVSAGTSLADYVTDYNARGQEIGEYGTYLGEAILEEAHGYILMREIFLLKKLILTTKFEKMMGPALREGYWSPEEYDDYGNKYGDSFCIDDLTTLKYPGINKPDLIDFVWDSDSMVVPKRLIELDDKLYIADPTQNPISMVTYGGAPIEYDNTNFTTSEWYLKLLQSGADIVKIVDRNEGNVFYGESKISYELGVLQDKNYYLVIDLTRYLDRIKNYTNDLCFIYYDLTFLRLNEELTRLDERLATIKPQWDAMTLEEKENNPTLGIEVQNLQFNVKNRETERKCNIKNAMRWFKINSKCEFAFVKYEGTIRPVLLVTGVKDLSEDALDSVYTSMTGFEPFLGTVDPKTVDDPDSPNKLYIELVTTRISLNNENLMDDYLNLRERDTTAAELYHILVRAGMGAYMSLGLDNSYNLAITNFWNDYNANPSFYDEKNKLHKPLLSSKRTKCFNGPESFAERVEMEMMYPRLRIDSLELNLNTVLLAVNKKEIKTPDNYSILIEEDKTDDTEKNFITIKPNVFIKLGITDYIIDIDYALSNAAEAIYLDAVKVAKENAYPKVSYEVLLNMLNPDMIKIAYSLLRRVVYINDVDLLLENVAGYISHITLSLDRPWEDEVEIKNYETKFEDLFSTIVALTEAMKKSESAINFAAAAFSTGGVINSSVLLESMLKADLSYAFNQGTLTIDEKRGIWATSDAGVVAIRGGGIFTATEKDINGEWKWNTGILPSGINADLITSGQIDTNKINIYAGDEVRFLMNGQGLFAYKALFSDLILLPDSNEEDTPYKRYIASKDGDIDASQFITYNENGMYLVAKKGALVLNKDKNDYIEVGKKNGLDIANFPDELYRVEISWDGLKLRDWTGTEVFNADPDTGDLRLYGEIHSGSGDIGGWEITPTALISETKLISLISAAGEAGIYLTAKNGSAITISYQNKTYSAYTIQYDSSVPTADRDTTEYYFNSNVTNFTTSNGQICLKYVTAIVNTTPIATLIDEGNIYIAIPGTNNPLLYNDEKIQYNGVNSPTALWYLKIVSLVASTGENISTYVIEESGYTLLETSLASGTRMTLTNYAPTFSVEAETGKTVISNGLLGVVGQGGFELRPTGLYSGNLNSVNINYNSNVMVGSTPHNIGNCFDLFESNSEAGTFTLTRINGAVRNFNIAETAFFKNAISAATVIQTLGVQDWGSYTEDNKTTIVAQATGFNGICSDARTEKINTGQFYKEGRRSRDGEVNLLKARISELENASQRSVSKLLGGYEASSGAITVYVYYNDNTSDLTKWLENSASVVSSIRSGWTEGEFKPYSDHTLGYMGNNGTFVAITGTTFYTKS